MKIKMRINLVRGQIFPTWGSYLSHWGQSFLLYSNDSTPTPSWSRNLESDLSHSIKTNPSRSRIFLATPIQNESLRQKICHFQ